MDYSNYLRRKSISTLTYVFLAIGLLAPMACAHAQLSQNSESSAEITEVSFENSDSRKSVKINPLINLYVSGDIDESTLNSDNISISRISEENNSIPTSVGYGDGKITIGTYESLKPGYKYSLTISGGLKSEDGGEVGLSSNASLKQVGGEIKLIFTTEISQSQEIEIGEIVEKEIFGATRELEINFDQSWQDGNIGPLKFYGKNSFFNDLKNQRKNLLYDEEFIQNTPERDLVKKCGKKTYERKVYIEKKLYYVCEVKEAIEIVANESGEVVEDKKKLFKIHFTDNTVHESEVEEETIINQLKISEDLVWWLRYTKKLSKSISAYKDVLFESFWGWLTGDFGVADIGSIVLQEYLKAFEPLKVYSDIEFSRLSDEVDKSKNYFDSANGRIGYSHAKKMWYTDRVLIESIDSYATFANSSVDEEHSFRNYVESFSQSAIPGGRLAEIGQLALEGATYVKQINYISSVTSKPAIERIRKESNSFGTFVDNRKTMHEDVRSSLNFDGLSGVEPGNRTILSVAANLEFIDVYRQYLEDNKPVLTDGVVEPSSGSTNDEFTFEVVYQSGLETAPDDVNLVLDGTTYNLDASGNSYADGVTFNFSKSDMSTGTHEYYFQGTAGGESLRNPASGSHEFTVTESAIGYDLEVASAEISDTSPNPGSSFDFKINVRNIGEETYSSVPLTAELTGPGGSSIDAAETSVSLDPGENEFNTLSMSLPSGASDGQHQVTVRVEPDLDENPANNQVTRSFLVGETLATNQYAIDNIRHVSTDPDAISSDPTLDGVYPELQGPSVSIGSSTFEIESISDDDILISDPAGNQVILAEGEVRYWPDYEASMAITQIDIWSNNQRVVYVWAGPETTQGPSFDSREITAQRSQTAIFQASAPSSGDFEDQDEDVVFIEEDDPETSDYRDWFDDLDADGDQAEISFDVPSDANQTSHGFSVMTRHEGGTRAYLSTVDINVVGRPSISVDPSSFSTSVEQGKTASREITIENNGSATLTWSLSSNADWLGPGNTGALEPGNSTTISVTIGEGDLAPGTFEGQFTVTSNDESNGTVPVGVTHTVESVPQITVASPSGGENWQIGSTQTIEWTGQNLQGSAIDIDLRRNGESVTTLVSDVDGSQGSYDWTISEDRSAGSEYTVRVEAVSKDAADQSGEFTLEGPQLSVSPTSLSFANGSATKNFGITNSSGGTLDWSITEDASWLTVSPESGSGAQTVDVTAEENTSTSSRSATLTVKSQEGGSETVSIEQSAQSLSPEITVDVPNGGEAWEVGTTHAIEWSSQDLVGSTIDIELLQNGSPVTAIVSETADDGTYDWTISEDRSAGSGYTVRMEAAGKNVSDQSEEFELKTPSETPSMPTDLQATAGDRQVKLSWSAGGDSSPAGYNVYRSTSSFSDISEATKVNSSLISETRFTDNDLTSGTEYFYRVTAVDKAGNRSPPSSQSRERATYRPGNGYEYFVTDDDYDSETDDIPGLIDQEFGTEAALADWKELKDLFADDKQALVSFLDGVGMPERGESAFVKRNGERFHNGGDRHYFMSRHNGSVPGSYLVHDQMHNNTVSLGSWYTTKKALVRVPADEDTDCPLAWTAELEGSDAGGSSQTLRFGQGSGATSSLDETCGERAPPSPPSDNFDLRFTGEGLEGVDLGLTGSRADFRAETSSEQTWRAKLQAGTVPATLSWDKTALQEALPDRSLRLFYLGTDGGIVSTDMKQSGSVQLEQSSLTLEIRLRSSLRRTVSVSSGWNMASMPVKGEAKGLGAALPEDCGTRFRWRPGQGLYQEFSSGEGLSPGQGAWTFCESGATVEVTGQPVATSKKTVQVEAGWNQVGPFEEAIAPSDVAQKPSGVLEAGTWFRWDPSQGRYTEPTSLEPGAGYWVFATGSGTLDFSGGGGSAATASAEAAEAQANGEASTSEAPEGALKLHVTEEGGHEATLYLAPDLTEEERKRWRLPPVGPGGAFDVRFAGGFQAAQAGGSSSETGQAGRREGPLLRVRGAEDPVTLRLGASKPSSKAPGQELESRSIRVVDAATGGKQVEARLTGESPAATVPAGIERLRVQVGKVPKAFALENPYPNPSGGRATLKYAVPEEADLTIAVYDVLGRRVVTLADGKKAAGTYRARLDGSRLSSGVYFARMEAEGFRETRRLTILR